MIIKNKIGYCFFIPVLLIFFFCADPQQVSVEVSGMPDGNFLELMEGQEKEVVETLADLYCGMPGASGCYPAAFVGDLTYAESAGFKGMVRKNSSGDPVEADVAITLTNWAGLNYYKGIFNAKLTWERSSSYIEYNGNTNTPVMIDKFIGYSTVYSSGRMYNYNFNYTMTTVSGSYPPVYLYEGNLDINNISYTFSEEIQ